MLVGYPLLLPDSTRFRGSMPMVPQIRDSEYRHVAQLVATAAVAAL